MSLHCISILRAFATGLAFLPQTATPMPFHPQSFTHLLVGAAGTAIHTLADIAVALF